MDKIRNEIESLMRRATVVALSEVERRARKEVEGNSRATKFTMAMGTMFFSDDEGILHDYVGRTKLFDFVREYDRDLGITGNPMHIEKGKNYTLIDW